VRGTIAGMRRIIAAISCAALSFSCTPDGTTSQKGAPQPEAPHSRAETFSCYKEQPGGGKWRTCVPMHKRDSGMCDYKGCFEREEAYCFQYRFSDSPSGRATVCTPSSRECEEWNADRQNMGEGQALTPCVLARPDEYID